MNRIFYVVARLTICLLYFDFVAEGEMNHSHLDEKKQLNCETIDLRGTIPSLLTGNYSHFIFNGERNGLRGTVSSFFAGNYSQFQWEKTSHFDFKMDQVSHENGYYLQNHRPEDGSIKSIVVTDSVELQIDALAGEMLTSSCILGQSLYGFVFQLLTLPLWFLTSIVSSEKTTFSLPLSLIGEFTVCNLDDDYGSLSFYTGVTVLSLCSLAGYPQGLVWFAETMAGPFGSGRSLPRFRPPFRPRFRPFETVANEGREREVGNGCREQEVGNGGRERG